MYFSVGDELQSSLADILGYEDLDLIGDLIAHREVIVNSAPEEEETHHNNHNQLPDDVILRLMTREQRDEALRQQDIEHKSKPLGPRLAGASVDYPHIYRAHETGNTLNAYGQKYSLPVGSTRQEFEVCILLISNFCIVILTGGYRNMKNSRYLRQKWGQSGGPKSWLRFRAWIQCAEIHSRDINR